ncbi:MAG: hypothetical protein ACRD3O_21210 [Terriglobia bacterium]
MQDLTGIADGFQCIEPARPRHRGHLENVRVLEAGRAAMRKLSGQSFRAVE